MKKNNFNNRASSRSLQHSGNVVESIYKKDKWGEPMFEMIMELSDLVNQGDIREGF